MLYSASKKFLFMANSRCGSTTTSALLGGYCLAPGALIRNVMHETITEHGIFGARGPMTSDATYFWHMPAERIRANLSEDIWESCLKVANIRNPFTRILSNFSRLVRLGKFGPFADVNQLRAAFETFLWELNKEKLKSEYGSTEEESKRITWIGDEFVIDHCVMFEDFKNQIGALADRLDLNCDTTFPHLQKSAEYLMGLPVHEIFSDASRTWVLKHFAWVFDRFGYSENPEECHKLPTIL